MNDSNKTDNNEHVVGTLVSGDYYYAAITPYYGLGGSKKLPSFDEVSALVGEYVSRHLSAMRTTLEAVDNACAALVAHGFAQQAQGFREVEVDHARQAFFDAVGAMKIRPVRYHGTDKYTIDPFCGWEIVGGVV